MVWIKNFAQTLSTGRYSYLRQRNASSHSSFRYLYLRQRNASSHSSFRYLYLRQRNASSHSSFRYSYLRQRNASSHSSFRFVYLRHLTETPLCGFGSTKEGTLFHLFWVVFSCRCSLLGLTSVRWSVGKLNVSETKHAFDSVWRWLKWTDSQSVWPN